MTIPGKMRRVPNIVCACIDANENNCISGRLFNLYEEAETDFTDIAELVKVMDNFFDRVEFPQASVKSRRFKKSDDEDALELINKEEKKHTFDDLMEQKGVLATFFIYVSGRVNATWQGEVYWNEGQRLGSFNSDIELMKLIELALEQR